MKLFLTLTILALIISISLVNAVEVSEDVSPQSNAELIAQMKILSEKVSALELKVQSMPSKNDNDSSFSQLDETVRRSGASNSSSTMGMLVIVALLNDIILAGLYLIGKSTRMIP